MGANGEEDTEVHLAEEPLTRPFGWKPGQGVKPERERRARVFARLPQAATGHERHQIMSDPRVG